MKFLFLLLLLPVLSKAQTDTVGLQRSVSKPGIVDIDTIRIATNSSAWIDMYLTGTTGKTFCRAKKSLYITNTAGVYKIVSNTNPIAFTGLTGGAWDVTATTVGVVVRIVGTTAITNWKITRLNL